MPGNFDRLESEAPAPEGGQPLSDLSPRFFPMDHQVRFTPDARIFWLDGLNQKEKSKKTFRLKKSVQIKTKSPILPTGASMV